MYKVTKYPHGTFSWADNSSTDPDKAKAFYEALFGWSKFDIPIDDKHTYTMFQLQGDNVAALSDMLPEGVPSLWFNYVTVDEVDPLAEVVTSNGGTIVHGPWDVFDSGRMLHIQDPTGAHLGLWQAMTHIGAGVINCPGAMCWNELLTWDSAAAKSFYATLLGWEYDDMDVGGAQVHIILNRGRRNGLIMQMDESFGDMPSLWQPYFAVADIDASVASAENLGGTIVIPKTEAPGAGHFAYLSDPAGAHFYIIQLIQAEPWVE